MTREDEITQQAQMLLQHMSLKEKIGQKLMLDFSYWCESKAPATQRCTQPLTEINSFIKEIISQNHLGGIILFSPNLKNTQQIITLNDAFQQTMAATHNLPLLISTDQEGGIVVRLPRDISVTFSGNMALAAAHLGHPEEPYAEKTAKIMATDLIAVGINVDFAPDVDVNVNPLNPIIHVRSFSDDPQLVSQLGLQFSQAIQSMGVAATIKHFPGHGDAHTDSHIGLPIVTHSLEQAWAIDLYPFKEIIAKNSPDLIMTAHIQFPALDNSQIYAGKIGQFIMVPATLSRKIQYDLLRQQLGYQGIIITDALGMGAIAQNFEPADAVLKAFQTGNDIALMPLSISQPADVHQLADLITEIEFAIMNGTLSLKEVDESVLRILKLKIKLGLLQPDKTSLAEKMEHAQKIFADIQQREWESVAADAAVTLVQNNAGLLPITLRPGTRIHIIMPWLEQGAGMAAEITKLQNEHKLPRAVEVSFVKMTDTNIEAEKHAIDSADIVIVGNSTSTLLSFTPLTSSHFSIGYSPPQGSLVFPELLAGDNDNSSHTAPLNNIMVTVSTAPFAFQVLQYAKQQGKKTIFLSLLAPYDLPNYQTVSDAMLAGYDFYGYLVEDGHGYYRGPSTQALTRVIFGISPAKGKLPINIPNPVHPSEIIYPRGYGLSTRLRTQT